MRVVSVQSWVAHGHVGNATALFALQRLGVETIGLHTVQFSNHTGYGDWTGMRFDAETIGSLADGVWRRGVAGEVDAVLSGYAGEAAIGEAVLEIVARVRSERPDALYACDPVMGDDGRGVFVRPELVGFFSERAASEASVMTPNRFELGLLTGQTDRSVEATARSARALLGRMRPGPLRSVLVTSADGGAGGGDPRLVELLLCTDRGLHRLRTDRIGIDVNGAGDLVSALYLAHLLALRDPVEAFARATSSTWGVIEATRRLGRRELALVAAQEELVRPSRRFEPVVC